VATAVRNMCTAALAEQWDTVKEMSSTWIAIGTLGFISLKCRTASNM
jgi:hypothetical protein